MATKSRSSAGDATGRKRQALAKEHADELKARGDEISLAQAEEDERAANGVFDPATGAEVALTDEEQQELAAQAFRDAASAGLAPGTRQVGDPGVETDDDGILYVDDQPEFGVQTNDTAILGVGMESPSQVLGGVPSDELVRQIVDKDSRVARTNGIDAVEVNDVVVADTPTKVIRVNTTLEDVTVGVGTSYTFEEGKQYRVPANVAAHLEEKGYVWH